MFADLVKVGKPNDYVTDVYVNRTLISEIWLRPEQLRIRVCLSGQHYNYTYGTLEKYNEAIAALQLPA